MLELLASTEVLFQDQLLFWFCSVTPHISVISTPAMVALWENMFSGCRGLAAMLSPQA